MGALVEGFSLHHGFVHSSPALDMGQVYQRSVQGAIDDCAALVPCAAISFRVGADSEGAKEDQAEGTWFHFKRYPAVGDLPPRVWPDPAWRTFVRDGAPPSAPVRLCDSNECAGEQLPCNASNAPQWGWPYRAARSSSAPRKLAFLNASPQTQYVYFTDGRSDSIFLKILPGVRREVLAHLGTLWRVRLPPPGNIIVREHVFGRLLVETCACGAKLAPLGLDVAQLDSAANAEGAEHQRRCDGKGEGEECEDAGIRDGGLPDSNQLELELFNTTPHAVRVVRARTLVKGLVTQLVTQLESGEAKAVQHVRVGDVLVACPVRHDGAAACAEAMLVHSARAEVRLGGCDEQAGKTEALEAVHSEANRTDRVAAERKAELEHLEQERAELDELLRRAQELLRHERLVAVDALTGAGASSAETRQSAELSGDRSVRGVSEQNTSAG